MADLLERLQQALGDRYRLDRELGRGGMAIVLLAEDRRHERLVAIKVLRPELAQSLAAERFLREIRIAAQLNHPNILTLIDSGAAAGFLYYIMPYVEGESLRARLHREQQLPVDEALRITREVADALSYAHSLGVIHRDIKPENILGTAGHAVVADFGIARAVSEAGGEHLTESGLAVGTPAYMSPEQAAGSGQVDARTDVYSLGCLLYEMLAGSPPYAGSTPQALLARKMLEPVPSLRVVRETIPPQVETAVVTALAKVPADRFATVTQFTAALAGHAVPSRPVRPQRRGRLVAAAMGIVALLAAVGYSLWLSGGRRAPPVAATYVQLTSAPGVELFPSLSPDGKWVVYAGEGEGNRDVYLQSVGGANAINLTGDSPANDDQPVFSPDGDRIAFRSEREGGGLFIMGRTGEAVKRVTRAGFNPSWAPDGTALVYATERMELNPQNANSRSELWVVDVTTGAARRVYGGDAIMPAWSPHGQRIAYAQRLATGRGVWTIPAAGGEPVAVTRDVARDWGPAWSPDGRFLYFASDRGGSMNLWRVPIDEASGQPRGDPAPITTPATSLAHITLAGDGRHLAYASALVTSNIQKLALDSRTGLPRGEPEWVTTGSRRWSSPDPSPDGAWVTFYTLVQPEGDLYVARTDGAELRQVTTGDSAVDRVPRWSPDGNWIAFFSNRAGPLTTWRIHPDGSGLEQLTDAQTSIPVWSPRGDSMAGATVTGATSYLFEIGRGVPRGAAPNLPLPPDTLTPFVPNSWSPDGERLVGSIGFADSGVVVYTFATGRYERLTAFGEWPVWLPDGRQVLFVSGGKAFYVVDRVTRHVRKVYAVSRDVIGPPRLTRDGTAAFYSRRVTEADVWMVTWP